jgi:hypothetical protein
VGDPKHHAVEETLKNGTAVTIRAARPGDGNRIRQAFSNLEAETIYTCFFGYKTKGTDAELARITGVDFGRDVALPDRPMRSVFRRSGLPLTLRHEDDAVHVTLPLLPVAE